MMSTQRMGNVKEVIEALYVESVSKITLVTNDSNARYVLICCEM